MKRFEMKGKAIVIGGQITVTKVSPQDEIGLVPQLDIFPIETSDKTIQEAGGFEFGEYNKGQDIVEVTISWLE